MEKKVKDLMSINFIYCNPNEDVSSVIKKMLDFKVLYLPIISDTGNLVGVIDIWKILEKYSNKNLKLEELFTENYCIVNENSTIKELLKKMKEKKKLYAIVINDENKVVGVIDIIDLLIEIPELKDFIISFIDISRKVK